MGIIACLSAHFPKVPCVVPPVKGKEELHQAEENVSRHLMEHSDDVTFPSLNITAATLCPLYKALTRTKEWTSKWSESHIMLQVGEFIHVPPLRCNDHLIIIKKVIK